MNSKPLYKAARLFFTRSTSTVLGCFDITRSDPQDLGNCVPLPRLHLDLTFVIFMMALEVMRAIFPRRANWGGGGGGGGGAVVGSLFTCSGCYRTANLGVVVRVAVSPSRDSLISITCSFSLAISCLVICYSTTALLIPERFFLVFLTTIVSLSFARPVHPRSYVSFKANKFQTKYIRLENDLGLIFDVYPHILPLLE